MTPDSATPGVLTQKQSVNALPFGDTGPGFLRHPAVSGGSVNVLRQTGDYDRDPGRDQVPPYHHAVQ